ncbi:Fic family protein [uncultured Ruminococcus sp.]|uniref:Fic/DOC family protein n=1 Tax=uncultured Ruminococcus sp. TaxID=165186 RepID=UPI00292EECFC|nr:Fic family protein [uncultured Ruminococcus sp.]
MAYSVDPINADCYEGTTCLINKYDIKDEAKLAELEAMITFAKSSELEQAVLKEGFNENDYTDIHRQLFEPLYVWAGEYRTINFSKKGTAFANYDDVPVLLTNCFNRLKAMNYFRDLPFDDFIEEIVDIYCTTNFIHPFREGNGRTQRVFLSQLIRYNGYEIHFSKIDTDYLMLATIHAAHGVVDHLKEIFTENIKPASS